MPTPSRPLSAVPALVLGALIAGFLFLTACTSSASVSAGGPSVKPDRDRKTAPDFTLKDANGTSVKLSDYRGKVVLLDFWATWCGPCKIEIPWFMEFEREYKHRGFAVLGVSMDEGGWETVKPYIEERKMNYRVLMGTEAVGDEYGGVDALPTTLLIDRDGRIATVHKGLETGKDGFKHEIERLLNADMAPEDGEAHPAAFIGLPAAAVAGR